MESHYKLGPFYDVDGTEIIPLGYEESHDRIEQSMGKYAVKSNLKEIHAMELLITNLDMTAFIQQDWNRVMAGNSPRGFLLAYRGGAYAAGRVAEEVVLKKLFRNANLFGRKVKRALYFWDAVDQDLVKRTKGTQSDDLILELSGKHLVVVEAKSTFRGTSYLNKSIPKIESQLQATLQANPVIAFVIAAFVDLLNHSLVIIGKKRETFFNEGLHELSILN